MSRNRQKHRRGDALQAGRLAEGTGQLQAASRAGGWAAPCPSARRRSPCRARRHCGRRTANPAVQGRRWPQAGAGRAWGRHPGGGHSAPRSRQGRLRGPAGVPGTRGASHQQRRTPHRGFSRCFGEEASGTPPSAFRSPHAGPGAGGPWGGYLEVPVDDGRLLPVHVLHCPAGLVEDLQDRVAGQRPPRFASP